MTRVGRSGRVVVPADMRQEMGLEDGSSILIRLDEEGLHISTPKSALTRAQAWVRRLAPDGASLTDTLIEERRQEGAKEP